MAVGNQASKNIDENIDWAAMASVLDLRNVFELVDHTPDDSPFSEQEFVDQRHQAVLHILSKFCNELEVKSLQELLKQSLGNVPAIYDQLAKQPFAQIRHRFAIVGAGRCNLTGEQFTVIVHHQVQFEAVKPIHRAFATIRKPYKDLVIVNAMVVTHAQRRRIDKRNAVTMTIQAFQVGAQGSKRRRHQSYKTFVTHPVRKLAAQMLAYMFRVAGFEIPILELMKVEGDGHDLTDTQLPSTKSFLASIFQLSGFPKRQKICIFSEIWGRESLSPTSH